jgi:hypothetical protein
MQGTNSMLHHKSGNKAFHRLRKAIGHHLLSGLLQFYNSINCSFWFDLCQIVRCFTKPFLNSKAGCPEGGFLSSSGSDADDTPSPSAIQEHPPRPDCAQESESGHPWGNHPSLAPSIGRQTTKSVPLPISVWSSRWPWWAWMIRRAVGRPSPVPPDLVVK